MFNPGITDDRSLGDEIPLSSMFLIVNEVTEVTPVIEGGRFTEEVTTEPEIVSFTWGTGWKAINNEVARAVSITDAKIAKENHLQTRTLPMMLFRLTDETLQQAQQPIGSFFSFHFDFKEHGIEQRNEEEGRYRAEQQASHNGDGH